MLGAGWKTGLLTNCLNAVQASPAGLADTVAAETDTIAGTGKVNTVNLN